MALITDLSSSITDQEVNAVLSQVSYAETTVADATPLYIESMDLENNADSTYGVFLVGQNNNGRMPLDSMIDNLVNPLGYARINSFVSTVLETTPETPKKGAIFNDIIFLYINMDENLSISLEEINALENASMTDTAIELNSDDPLAGNAIGLGMINTLSPDQVQSVISTTPLGKISIVEFDSYARLSMNATNNGCFIFSRLVKTS